MFRCLRCHRRNSSLPVPDDPLAIVVIALGLVVVVVGVTMIYWIVFRVIMAE